MPRGRKPNVITEDTVLSDLFEWDENENGCYVIKNRSTDRYGYGQISIDGKIKRVHRVAWEIANKASIMPGMFVLHSCDNPPCLNPDHLRVGTHQDNMDDRGERNRHPDRNGEKSHSVKFTELQVVEILTNPEYRKMTAPKLAEKFGVTGGTVADIRYGCTWKKLIRERNLWSCLTDNNHSRSILREVEVELVTG